MNKIPDGFVENTRRSAVTDAWEPIYVKKSKTGFALAIEVRECHCNGRGFLHGGVIASLADNSMGTALVGLARKRFENESLSAVTLSLTTDYIGTGRIGDWLEFRPDVLKLGKSVGFTDLKAIALREGEEILIARANATFKLV